MLASAERIHGVWVPAEGARTDPPADRVRALASWLHEHQYACADPPGPPHHYGARCPTCLGLAAGAIRLLDSLNERKLQ